MSEPGPDVLAQRTARVVMETGPRRRILCLRPRTNPTSAPFIRAVNGEWTEALSRHATIEIVNHDCDLKQLCDAFTPDFVVFEALNWSRPWPLQITNADCHPTIPRTLLLNIDPHEPLRPVFYELLSFYRIETVFQHSGPCHHHVMPELKFVESFTLPHFIDEDIFKDYGLDKIIPVSIFSAHLLPSFYDWRAQVTEDVQRLFPTLLYPHPGYGQGQASAFAVQGEAYARLINQSCFSVADTTRLDYVVRKHLEIPAAGAVLVAPSSPALAEYGFQDGVNCLLGSGLDLYRTIDAVSREPERYASIKAAGQALVQARYTRDKWRYILDWFACRTRLAPGERVKQDGVFGTFSAARPASGAATTVPLRDNQLTAILRAARTAVLTGHRLDVASGDLQRAAAWAEHIAEPIFLLGMIALLQGRPADGALAMARRATDQGRLDAALVRFDPVEIAWILLAATLLGQDDLVRAMREQAAVTRHLGLRRAQWLLSGAADDPLGTDPGLHERLDGDVMSIHWLGQERFEVWLDLVRRVCLANGRPDLILAPATSPPLQSAG